MAWVNKSDSPSRGFLTPPPTRNSRPRQYPMSERKWSSPPVNKGDTFHVIHKVPAGDSPYVKAKQVQLIEKDPSRAISLFWAAINAGDRVDSALKDMAIVMKQLNRSDEAIEAIKSFRHLCPYDAQESLDNVLLELYKRSGRIEEEIEMLQRKLKNIEEGTTFGGKRTKIARSQGKKIQITTEQEKSRILGNLAWAYLQLNNYTAAEDLYRKALSLEPDKNKQCNLAICLMHTNRIAEAKSLLQAVKVSSRVKELDESCTRSLERALQVMNELESGSVRPTENVDDKDRNSGNKITQPLCSPQNTFVDRWKNGSFSENQSDRRVCSPGENHDAPPSGINISSACKNTFSSPCVGRTAKAPFVEHRRCSWGFHGRDQRRDIWENNAAGSSGFKLPFNQHKVYENLQASTIQELNDHSPGGEYWRRGSSQPVVIGDQKTNPLEKDDKKTELAETILYEGKNQSCYANVSGNRLQEASAKNPQPVHDCLTGRSKKSWADMVEEEESLCGRIDFLSDLLKDSSFSFQAGCNDENLDSNITHHAHCPPNQIQVCSKKKNDLEDGCYASGDVASLRNLKKTGSSDSYSLAKRALNFKDDSVMVSNEMEPEPWKRVNHRRKNRLQVFEDITGTI